MSLRWRFALTFAGGVILVTAAVAAGAVWSTERSLQSEIDMFLEERAAQTSRVRIPDLGAAAPLIIEQFAESGRFASPTGRPPIFPAADSIVQVNQANGTLSVMLADAPELPAVSPDGTSTIRTATIADTSYRVIAFPVNGADYVVQIGRDLTETEAVLDRLRGQIVITGLVLAALAFAAGWLIARRVATPLEELSAAADRLASGEDPGAVTAPEGADEVGRLGRSFNTMVAALANSKAQQRRLVQDASHELRTPLTSLRTNVEVLRRTADIDDTERAKILDDLDVEVRELSDLVTELVELATDVERSDETPREVELASIAETAAERVRRRTGRSVIVEGRGPAFAMRPSMIERAVSNLIDNAHKWSPDGSPITVSVSGTRLAVLDDGPGIPPEDVDKIFQRFYRSDAARATPGSGLGLAIVAQIVAAHEGTVFARNRPGGGAEVGFEMA